MKNNILAILTIIILGGIVHQFAPWWSIVIVAAIVGMIFHKNAGSSVLFGFVGALLLWGIVAFQLDSGNESILSTRMGNIFQDIGSGGMLAVTALIGGLLGAMGALTGTLGRRMF